MSNLDEKKIVLARLETMPQDMNLSIGNVGSLNKWELMEHVQREDEIGKIIMQVYMSSLRAFKEQV